MPGSLLTATSPATLRGVARNESTRSDSSAASNTSQGSANGSKKVSFNRAVRVKKYPRPRRSEADENGTAADDGGGKGTPSKRFWFRVYKNRHRHEPDPGELRGRSEVIYYANGSNGTNGFHERAGGFYPATAECGTQTPKKGGGALLGNEATPLHPSQMTDPPQVRRNHVKKIVTRFNEEAVLQRQLSGEGEPGSPPGSPRMHSTPKQHQTIPAPPPPPPPVPPPGYDTSRPPPPEGLFSAARLKKNPIVNGVKVMFGMGQGKKGDSDYAPNGGDYKSHRDKDLYRGDAALSDESETFVKTPYSPSDTFLYGDYDDKALVRRDDNYDLSHGNGYHDDDGYHRYDYDDNGDRKGKYHVETWDSGNQLLFDTADVNTSTSRTDKGEFTSTVGEKHQLWQNNKRVIVYEEPTSTIIRRKAKSHTDLSNSGDKVHHEDKLDKGISTEDLNRRKHDKGDTLSKRSKDWLRSLKSSVRDKGVQCSQIPTDEPEELYGFGRYKIIRPRNGVVSAFSNVPPIQKARQDSHQTTPNSENGYSKDSVIYSQVDKSKKKKNKGEKEKKESKLGGLFKARSEPLYLGPPPQKSQQYLEDELESNYFEDRGGERVVKTSRKSFGFKLNAGRERNSNRGSYEEQDWYDIDGDIEANRRNRGLEPAFEEETDVSSLSNGEQHRRNGHHGAGSVVREVDYKKREISYENVPRSDGENNPDNSPAGISGLWYREADEDYRREMAQSEVSYPAGNSVGSERFYTVDRRDKASKSKLPPPSPRAYTLDRRHLKSKDKQKPVANTSGVKIMVNGKELKDKASTTKKGGGKRRDDPSSVQSDPLYVRGGLAAAYQARQRANIRRSNSTASGLSSKYRIGGGSPSVRRIVAGTSEMSAASSESESGKVRRPLVMYIPGVSHTEKASDAEDRVSSTIARSHSMMAPARPPRASKKFGQKPSGKSSRANHYVGNGGGDVFEEEEDEIMPLASDYNRKKPPRVPHESRKQGDIKRRHSMPKDTKFSWLKWRIRGKPSREP